MAGRSSGYTLVEVLVGLFLIAVGVMAAAPMFMYVAQGNAAGADVSSGTAVAVERMEILRSMDFWALVEGGDLDSNVPGYSERVDHLDVRWKISSGAGPAGSKTIEVRAVSDRPSARRDRDVRFTTLRCPQ